MTKSGLQTQQEFITKMGNCCENVTPLITPVNNTLTIPYGWDAIPYCSFSEADITAVEIPRSVKKIGRDAFFGTYLQTVFIPDSVKTVHYDAFLEAIKLKNGYWEGEGGSFFTVFTDGCGSDRVAFEKGIPYVNCSASTEWNFYESPTAPSPIQYEPGLVVTHGTCEVTKIGDSFCANKTYSGHHQCRFVVGSDGYFSSSDFDLWDNTDDNDCPDFNDRFTIGGVEKTLKFNITNENVTRGTNLFFFSNQYSSGSFSFCFTPAASSPPSSTESSSTSEENLALIVSIPAGVIVAAFLIWRWRASRTKTEVAEQLL